MRRRTVQPEIRSFVLVLRSPVTPFDRSKTKDANCFEECNVFGNAKCKLSAIQEGRKRCNFLARKSAYLFANIKVHIFGKETCETHRQFQRYFRWCHFRLTLSLSLYLSLSPSAPHAQYRKRFRASYNSNKELTWVRPQSLCRELNVHNRQCGPFCRIFMHEKKKPDWVWHTTEPGLKNCHIAWNFASKCLNILIELSF